ncbi:hypothetical protein GCM10025873_25540 [Demequina sediminis]|nr:hypothetical protein GCM10025873_25540 [Demequina sediminis]
MSSLAIDDSALAEVLQPRLALVEERLRDAVAQSDTLADATSRHLVDAGGKRLRPMLVLLCAQLGDGARPEVLDAAVVVELTHLATLYHDDVMDSAPTRRGAPAAHEVWGNSVAILTGDLLFARASRVVAGLGPQAVRIQAETFERLCLGQLHETVGAAEGDDPVDFYLQVLADKTASLIATSARFGAMFGGCPVGVVDQVTSYGEYAGVAFQLADDVIDVRSDAATTGKTPGTDLREGVPTMPVLLLRRRVAAGGPGSRPTALFSRRSTGTCRTMPCSPTWWRASRPTPWSTRPRRSRASGRRVRPRRSRRCPRVTSRRRWWPSPRRSSPARPDPPPPATRAR